MVISLALAGCGSKSPASTDAAASKTSSAAPAAATTEADASGIYPIKPKAALANAKLLKSDLRYGHYTYLVTNTSPDTAADYVRKAVGDVFSVECLPIKAGEKA